jgi:ubiquinone/menaquinone biosynthesis C-methylase UbiE
MGALDVYRITNELDDDMSEVLATRLEARGRHPAFLRMLAQYLDAMGIDSAGTVLDMGCGTGVAARTLARRPRFTGRVVGIDRSPYLVSAAERLARAEGLTERVEFRTGDTHSLTLADASFDAVIAHTLISHVEDPAAVLAEMRRVVRPGGMVGVFDGDYASITFAQDDLEQGKRDDEAIIAAIVTNPRVMRMMPRMVGPAGLELVAFFPHVVAEIGRTDFWTSSIASFRKLLPRSGVWSQEKANAWADDMLRASEEGRFFGATNFYAYVLRRP